MMGYLANVVLKEEVDIGNRYKGYIVSMVQPMMHRPTTVDPF
jgi:hypothetical protein